MAKIDEVMVSLRAVPKRWLVTGVAGFIGSNLLEQLLNLGQQVVGLDNLSAGYMKNLEDVREVVGEDRWANFTFFEGDTRALSDCAKACQGVDIVLHQAALGSVPRSVADPIATNQSNLDGFLNMLIAARDAHATRFVYASSSSVYGDEPNLPKVEDKIGRPLSPYAVTKYTNELYADVFGRTYGLDTIGLRYFNVFGKRQDPNGAYAAVIPRWIGMLLQEEQPEINGDGAYSRDFTHVRNVVQANLLGATVRSVQKTDRIFNVAFGGRTTLNELFEAIKESVVVYKTKVRGIEPIHGSSRLGDIPHSLADISRARNILEYEPTTDLRAGLKESVTWYLKSFGEHQFKA